MRVCWAAALLAAACAPTGKAPPRQEGSVAATPAGPVVPPPMLIPPRSPAAAQLISLQGYATPAHRVEVFINGVLQGETVARADGVFEFRGLLLQPGSNRITAVAIDDRGNRSEDRPAGGGARAGTGGTLKREVNVEFRP